VAGADAVLPALLASMQALLADKAYDAQERVLERRQNAGIQAVRPPKKNRKDQRAYDKDQRAYDKELDKARPQMENCLAKPKQLRGIATRYDKRATTFLGAVYLAAVIWLN
jgi:transposase